MYHSLVKIVFIFKIIREKKSSTIKIKYIKPTYEVFTYILL